jgi:hypothetical protein
MTLLLQTGGGFMETVGGAAVAAGTVILVLMLVAMGTYAYKQLRGGGVEWPEDKEEPPEETGDGLSEGGDEDEWDYY